MTEIDDFKAEVEKMGFEAAMEALEALVKELEDGGADLDRSLQIYERAAILRDHCKVILEDGQRRIQKIIESSDGVKIEDFDS